MQKTFFKIKIKKWFKENRFSNKKFNKSVPSVWFKRCLKVSIVALKKWWLSLDCKLYHFRCCGWSSKNLTQSFFGVASLTPLESPIWTSSTIATATNSGMLWAPGLSVKKYFKECFTVKLGRLWIRRDPFYMLFCII